MGDRESVGATVVDLIEAQVDRDPDALAIAGEDSAFTYRELDVWANRIAHALSRVDPDRARAHAGVLVSTGAWPAVSAVGVVKSGRVAVPLDVDAPTERLLEIERQTGPMVMVTDRAHRHLVDPDMPMLVLEDLPAALPSGRPRVPIGPDDGFLINFTSGSTGRPKGALRNHRAQVESVANLVATSGFGPGLRLGLVHGPAFAASRATVWGGLGSGCSIHVRDVRTHGPRGLARWLARERIANIQAPASLMDAMVELDPPDGILEDLVVVMIAGDVLRADTVRRLRPLLPRGAVIRNVYGSSEMGGVASHEVRADTPLEADLVPAGRIRRSTEVRIDDPDDRGVGEILVAGAMVTVGYVDDSTDARGSYQKRDGRRWFRSGDLGRIRGDGLLEVQGRLDDRVKIRSQTIDPSEVELALHRRPDVADVHVGARPVGGRDRLVAWIEPRSGAKPSTTSVRRDLRREIPAWMIPQSVLVVDRLPRTERGKVDRSALPLPTSARPLLETPCAPPRTPLERRLGEAFAEVLGIADVGRNDEFFDLGGDSLAAAELVDHVSRALGRDLPMAAFLEAATPADLADRLMAEPEDEDDRLLTFESGGDGVPVVLVHQGHGFALSYRHLAASLGGGRPVLGLQMLARDPARDLFSVPRLSRRYAELLDRCCPGPVIVAGHSAGGVLAHALAGELSDRGRAVRACVLLDPVGPGAARPKAKALAYDLLALTPVRLRHHRLTTQRGAAAALSRRRHHPACIDVPIVLARGDYATPERWEGLTDCGMTVVDAPGEHVTMLHPPHAAVLAKRLEPVLERFDERRAGAPTAK